MRDAQKLAAVNMISQSYKEFMRCRFLLNEKRLTHIIQDELCLHRANSILHLSRNWLDDTKQYFSMVPVPDAAIFILSSVDEIWKHVEENHGKRKNCYALFETERALKEAIDRLIEVNLLGSLILSKRGVIVKVIDRSTCSLKESCKNLDEAIEEILSIDGC